MSMSPFAAAVEGFFKGREARQGWEDKKRQRERDDQRWEWEGEDRDWTREERDRAREIGIEDRDWTRKSRGRAETEWSQEDEDRARRIEAEDAGKEADQAYGEYLLGELGIGIDGIDDAEARGPTRPRSRPAPKSAPQPDAKTTAPGMTLPGEDRSPTAPDAQTGPVSRTAPGLPPVMADAQPPAYDPAPGVMPASAAKPEPAPKTVPGRALWIAAKNLVTGDGPSNPTAVMDDAREAAALSRTQQGPGQMQAPGIVMEMPPQPPTGPDAAPVAPAIPGALATPSAPADTYAPQQSPAQTAMPAAPAPTAPNSAPTPAPGAAPGANPAITAPAGAPAAPTTAPAAPSAPSTDAAPSPTRAAAAAVQTAAASIGIDPTTPAAAKDSRMISAFQDDYTQRVAPKIVNAYIKAGQPEKAKAFVDFLKDRNVKTAQGHWSRAVLAATRGDEKGFVDGIAAAYNTKGFFDDGYRIVPEESGFMRENGALVQGKARITFENEATGEKFTQVVEGQDDLYRLGIEHLSAEAAFERRWAAFEQGRATALDKEPSEKEITDYIKVFSDPTTGDPNFRLLSPGQQRQYVLEMVRRGRASGGAPGIDPASVPIYGER
ncbi:hypothetical protein [Mesobacterium pallidum]|uniref:hypothetical protein n=1 Tax=Mesobacterium pallidum TaxID=2872037 RepID=UPI001EE28485|nr:hypothetical protein [Mesobacterium pallidum]